MKTNKLWEKLLASIMVVMLTAGNLIVIGNSMHTYAEGNLEAQNERTSSANVEFGAYFKSEGTISHSLESDASEEQELYMHLKVKDGGYLKNDGTSSSKSSTITESLLFCLFSTKTVFCVIGRSKYVLFD